MAEVVVVGSLNMDLNVRTPHLPVPGETVIGSDFTTAPGGKGANQAVAAARLGASVAMVGRVGSGDFGTALRANLQAAGVDDTYVFTDHAAPTGVALIAVEEKGQNTIIVVSGANGSLSRADVDAALGAIAAARILALQLEIPIETVMYALELARASHVLTLLNPAPARRLPPELIRLVDILVPNETEAEQLTGIPVRDWESAEKAARELGRRGAEVVVITMGARGALGWDGGAGIRSPAYHVEAIDATAAGDAFVGALAVARAHGLDLPSALREANTAGALATLKAGAQPSLPTRAEMEEFAKRGQLKSE